MDKIKVVIAEDNDDSRIIMKEFIQDCIHYEIVGEATNGEELVHAIFDTDPDIVLVDIHMPKLDGVSAMKECLKVKPDLKIIFVTAYDQYAVEAFNISAVDYIVKPIERSRLLIALEKGRNALLHYTNLNLHKRLLVKYERSVYVIPIEKILFIEKMDRKSLIHTCEQVYQTYETLISLEQQINDNAFTLSHRSFLINLHQVTKITTSGETYLAYFHTYTKSAHISKQKIQLIQELIKVSG